jgi:glutathione S-transferase
MAWIGSGTVRPSRLPEKRLELWIFEASPYCRLVRERLCELELQVPWLFDPNTGAELFESEAIVDYLDKTYGA